ncbi:MAG: DUF3806 domain-containing protein [Prosthecobacter sp.]|nr:DUF3806 domain-containing protein [Prosthecobacter sp.]
MTKPTFQQITDAELQWIESQLAAGKNFVAHYSSRHRDLSLEALDEAWTAWMATSQSDADEINHAINCIGIPFGSLLISTGEFAWCIASDDWGTDLAVRALPDRGDVLVYPADFVSKRWESRTTDFLVAAFPQIMEHVSQLRQKWVSTCRSNRAYAWVDEENRVVRM